MEKQWDNIYGKKGEKYEYYNIFEPHKDMAEVSKIFSKNKINTVLDLGCGAGRNLFFLTKTGFTTYGMDYAPEGVKLLKSKLKSLKLKSDVIQGSFYDPLPYSDSMFDAVISVQSLQHGTEKKILAAITEISRVLKPNGLIFITLAGRVSKGKVRYCLVKTAKKIAPNTYLPTIGDETGLVHFIYNKEIILKHFKNFNILKMWRDDKDYYCIVARKK
ncbi:MAG: methyltransferase domain-containing protein [Candidatus Woesearchaeota archaeon]